LIARLETGVSARSVAAGRHAFELAEALTATVRALRPPGAATQDMVHLFMACPGSIAFFLGQRQSALGRLTLYEFDFEASRSGSYQPSIEMPVAAVSMVPDEPRH
jgi:hypothetical protein